MKILTYNINGIRSAESKGLFNWIDEEDADLICIQEVRASEEQAKTLMGVADQQISLFSTPLFLEKYHVICNCGQVAGYAGTMILSKQNPDKVVFGLDGAPDFEGRCTTAFYNNLAVVNCYVPNGGSRLDFKMEYFKKLTKYLNSLKQTYNVIFLSDANIAHTELDLSHPKECSKRTGFLPLEREALTKLLDCGFCDLVRKFNSNEKVYTWRSYKSRNPEVGTDYGWKYRFDYILCSTEILDKFTKISIPDLPYSDHLPIIAESNLSLN